MEKKNNTQICYEYNLLDRYTDGVNSMSRTTGYTCTAANLVLTGKYKKIGISPPEYLGEHFEFVKDYLEERGVIYKKIRNESFDNSSSF